MAVNACPPVVALVGSSGVGKTTLLEGVVRQLVAGGLKVATIKRTHHPVFTDEPGTDSYRHRESGASRTCLSGPGFVTVFHEPTDVRKLAALVGEGCDLVLVEGYKTGPFPKIEVVREGWPSLGLADLWLSVTSDQVEEVVEAIRQRLRE